MTHQHQTSSSQKPVRSGELSLPERLIQIWGVAFVLAGLACFFDVGGFASALFEDDGDPELLPKLIGGMVIVIGLADILIIPQTLARAREKKSQ